MNRLGIAAFIALTAMIGSLYFSIIKGYTPCTFCWVQRILMYPLPWLLGAAFFFKDKEIVRYVIPMSILGFLISAFHYTQQKFLLFGESCQSLVPCSTIYIDWLGFITIPFLSMTAFLLILATLLIGKSSTD
ncbi:disulfide bond formation protein B (plasmid) [Pontibacillus sp. ALD_SL1]|uniref:disulfide oxidoreductase n=1 Tax=Pontibacillus sp. ALD_SL1 TaxID=2777185 RepID=UPI001A95B496|nr:disulfide oxidoreductase [Pontibacillus sp. ALD_SL1]QST02964.1 disulfide bond formation protein B [Pontibacillus sp. ALD_SL1]